MTAADPHHRAAVAGFFDAEYYLAAYPAARASALDPLDHFLLHGWHQGCNPSRSFDVRHYLATHADVAAAGINPLLHYAWTGQQEGRSTRRPLDAERQQLEASCAPHTRLAGWDGAADRSAPLGLAALEAALAVRAGQRGTVIAISHDDYAEHCGGIQSLIADEQAAFARSGWSYLHLSPASPLPMLAGAAPFRFRVRLDGRRVGVAEADDVLALVGSLSAPRAVVVHHMMGHRPELLARLCAAVEVRPWVWVHDFFTLCPSYALMRNDVRFCGAPPVASTACMVCTFGEDREAHAARMRDFFTGVRPRVLAPSASALALWLRRGDLAHESAGVLPLAHLAQGGAPAGTEGRPLRVAHVGGRVTHKGWYTFEHLALSHADDDRYAFLHLGEGGGPALPRCIRHVPVRVGPDDRNAMIEAVAEHRIDVVVSWSLWPETFCYALHEALAGGAFVVVRTAAGNVGPALLANAPGQGCLVDTEHELAALFASGEIGRRVLQAPRRYAALVRGSGAAASVLEASRPMRGPVGRGAPASLGLGMPADAALGRMAAAHA